MLDSYLAACALAFTDWFIAHITVSKSEKNQKINQNPKKKNNSHNTIFPKIILVPQV